MQMCPGDFDNPWNFFALMSLPDQEVYEWFRLQDLLVTNISCTSPDCNGEMFLRGAANKPGGAVFRCNKDRTHTKNCRCYSNTILKRKEAKDQEFSFDFLQDSDFDKTLTAG